MPATFEQTQIPARVAQDVKDLGLHHIALRWRQDPRNDYPDGDTLGFVLALDLESLTFTTWMSRHNDERGTCLFFHGHYRLDGPEAWRDFAERKV